MKIISSENVLINFQSLLQDPEEKSDFEKSGMGVCKTVQPGSINYAFSSPVLVCMRQILSAISIRLRSTCGGKSSAVSTARSN